MAHQRSPGCMPAVDSSAADDRTCGTAATTVADATRTESATPARDAGAKRRNLGLGLIMLIAVATGCGGGHPDPAPSAAVRPSGPLRRLEPGTAIVATASVSRVLAPNAFVIIDADLPVTGQLVVSEAPVTVLVHGLVTVTGRVERFDTAAFERYGLSDPQLYEPFSGVVIVADDVRRYLPASPSAG